MILYTIQNAEFEHLQALCLNMITHFSTSGKSVQNASVSREARAKWLLKAVGIIGAASAWNLDLIKRYSSMCQLPCRFDEDRICCPDLEDDLHALKMSNWLQCNMKLHQTERGVLVERIYSVPSMTL